MKNSTLARVTGHEDYYPGGSVMPERNWQQNSYRYSFNGKENISELNDWQDYGMRMYMRMLVRFPAPDPIADKYPELTPYQFASNTPIQAIDLDGLEATTIEGDAYEEINGDGDVRKPDGNNTTANGTSIVSNGRSFRYVPGDGMYEEIPRPRNSPSGQSNNEIRTANQPGRVEAVRGTSNGQSQLNVTNTQSVAEVSTSNTSTLRGSNNPKVRQAIDLGNKVHYDKLNGGIGKGLPSALSEKFSETEFKFTPRGAKGADVEVVGGKHPSQYPNSNWSPKNNFADFKPNTKSGTNTFNNAITNGKLPTNTQLIQYDPNTGLMQ